MAIHIQDEKTVALVREFARRRGVGITAAIKLAVSEAAKGDEHRLEACKERIRPLVKEIRDKRSGTPPVDQKAFMDEMWGEED
jgi:antitoxin VapB